MKKKIRLTMNNELNIFVAQVWETEIPALNVNYFSEDNQRQIVGWPDHLLCSQQ